MKKVSFLFSQKELEVLAEGEDEIIMCFSHGKSNESYMGGGRIKLFFLSLNEKEV